MIEKQPIVKAEPIKRDNTEDIAQLTKKVKQYEDVIKFGREELKLRTEITKAQCASPKTLKPNFEFETTPEWDELNKKQWKLSFKRQEMALLNDIEQTTRKRLELESEIKRLEEQE